MPGQLGRADDGIITLEGGTDATLIGNSADRLKVTSTLSGVPADNAVFFTTYLLNGASAAMNVSGSLGSPQSFMYAPSVGQVSYLTTVKFLLVDSGTMDPGDFGSITAGLTNGVVVEIRSQGVTYTYCTLRTNLDITLLLAGGGSGTTAPIFLGLGTTSGFLETSDVVLSGKGFSPPIPLVGSSGDYVKFIVRDNLTALDNFLSSIDYYRVI